MRYRGPFCESYCCQSERYGFNQMILSQTISRMEGGQLYCNIVLASDCSPTTLMDMFMVRLRGNRMGLWRGSIDAEQVSEIGWLLYSTCQQDEKHLAHLLSSLTGKTIGARWRVIHSTTAARKQKGPHDERNNYVRAIHLECETSMLQYAKPIVAHLYRSSAK